MNDMKKAGDPMAMLKNIALISGVFAMIMCLMIIVNYIQWKRSDPLNSKALVTLTERLKANPGDEQLRQDVRQLDLVARKAYFTSIWQVRVGGILLFISVLVILACFQAIDLLKKKIPVRPLSARDEIFFNKGRKRNTVMISGGSIILLTLILVFITGKDEKKSAEAKVVSVSTQKTDTSAGFVSTAVDTATISGDSVTGPAEGFATNAEFRENWPAFRGFNGAGVAFQNNL
ncbi:MAG: hypothetical protein ACM3N9_03080, partial [Syntrophothermus sp.]